MSHNYRLSAHALQGIVQDARELTLSLVADLEDRQLEVPYLPIVNPFRWELGHVAYFYEGFLLQYLDGTGPIATGGNDLYNSFEVDHEDRWHLAALPKRKEILAYLDQVLCQVVQRLETHEPSARETYCYLLAVLHEGMHSEAFAMMRQTLEYARPRVALEEDARWQGAGPHPGDVDVPGGLFVLGAAPDQPFVFDNEKWGHEVEVAPFTISRAPVTNREYAAFVEDRGYERRDLWTTQGWVWRGKVEARHPIYWRRDESDWQRRDYDCWRPIESHAPVSNICWYEAVAYCNWAGRRLPSECEWEFAASCDPEEARSGSCTNRRLRPWGEEEASPEQANLDFRSIGCVDVAAYPDADSAFGCRQMLGNVWEWTETSFYPYPGYVVDRPYREYSAPWFGYPKVLKGGSWATRSRLAHNVHRNFFRPDRRDVMAGFRTCAR